MSEETTELAKAVNKSLASHFKRSAAHEEKLAARHNERADTLKDDNGAASFHKAICKLHESHAQHLQQMAEALGDVAEKTAGAHGLAKANEAVLRSIVDKAFEGVNQSTERTQATGDDIRDTGL